MSSTLKRVLRLAGQASNLRYGLRGRRTAFVFSGGGNLGAVQVGMLRALTEAGIKPDIIVGCSVGAINGAGYAADPTMTGVERLDRLWRRMADGDPDLMPSRFIPMVAQMARKGEAMHDRDRLADLLDDELPTKTFAGLKVPFACVATDIDSASEYWFEHGRLVPALLASAALPAVYPAFEHRGRRFIDGGVLNEIHTAQAVAMGATELYVLHVGHLEGRDGDVQRPFDSAVRAYWTARRFRLEEDLRRVPDHCKVYRLPAGSNPRLRFDDFSQASVLSDLAYDATAEYLSTGRLPEPVSGPVSDPEHEAEGYDHADAADDGTPPAVRPDAGEGNETDGHSGMRVWAGARGWNGPRIRNGGSERSSAPDSTDTTNHPDGGSTDAPNGRKAVDHGPDAHAAGTDAQVNPDTAAETDTADLDTTADTDEAADTDAAADAGRDEPAAPGRPGKAVEARARDLGAERVSRAFSRWGSSSVGQPVHPPGWDDPDRS